MEENIRYNIDGQTLKIVIPPNLKGILKFGFGFQGILLLSGGIALFVIGLIVIADSFIGALILLVLFFFYYLFARTYFRKVFSIEIIEVTKKDLIITERFLLSRKKRTYPIAEISHFSFAGKQDFTSHPLEIKSFDATGWRVSESEIQFLIEDGTIQFFCNGAMRRFGKNVPSWDAEKMIKMIEQFAHNDLSTDDKMESLLKQLYTKKSNHKNGF